VQDIYSSASNTIQSSVGYSLPTNVNTFLLTGTGNLSATANSGADTLVSNSGADTLIGGSGNDTFIIDNIADVIDPGTGTTTVVYEAGSSFTLPTGVNSVVLSGTGNITATANSANDTLISNSGIDTLIGGAGNDLFVVSNSADVVQDTSVGATNTIQSSVSYILPANVNALVLTGSGNLSATGNSASDRITGNAGIDTLVAGAGLATLVGGSGNDMFVVNNTGDVVQDTTATTANTIQSSVNFTLVTNVNLLTLTGTAALVGTANAASDTLISNAGVDTLVGGVGGETFVVNNSADSIQDTSSTANNAVVSSVGYSLPANVNTLTLSGTANLSATSNSGNDSLVGNAGQDTLVATSGADTLVAGSGIATLLGGTSTDLFVVDNTADVVIATGTHGADTIQSSVSYTVPTSVNTLVLSGSANLVGTAVGGNNSLVGNAGSDTLVGGTGTDTLVAGAGPTTLIGGSASDVFVVNSTSDVIENAAAGSQVDASYTYSLSSAINYLTLTGSANLVGTGNTGADIITANAGNDTLVSGSGVDEFFSGNGNDLFIVGNTGDVVQPDIGGLKYGIDTIQSSVSYVLSNSVDSLELTGSANLTATGNPAEADSIVGNAGSDTLTAGGYNDTLVAGSGLATLIGGGGNDTFVVNNTADVVEDSLTGHSNSLMSSVSFSLPTNVNASTLTGSANLVGTANAANDSLTGNAGLDTLVGGSGTDTLVAGSGLATLVGGTGNDTFVVNSALDVIQSASSGGHNLILASSSFTLPTNVNALTLSGVANISATGNTVADTLTSGAGQDTLTAGSGLATLIGGLGNTTFVIDNANDVVQDTVSFTTNSIDASVSYTLVTNVNTLILAGTTNLSGTANGGNDTLVSNAGLDTLVGGVGNETFVVSNSADVIQDTATTASNVVESSVNYVLDANVNTLVLTGTGNIVGQANAANDTLFSNTGVDTLIGGSGSDIFVINNSADVVQDTAASASNQAVAAVSFVLPTNVNVLTLTGSAGLSATGNGASDVISANSGADTLIAGSGAATLIGGSGNDTFVVNSVGDSIQDTYLTTTNTVLASVSYSLPTNVEVLTLSGTSALSATANAGNDTLISNSGVDTITGGSGHDLIVVNNSADVLLSISESDTVESSVSYSLPAGVSSVQLVGSANISATGNSSADTLVAGAGADTLIAGSGAAAMVAGSGNDTFIVNSAADSIVNSSYAASDTVDSSVSYSLPSNVDTLTLTGTANLTGTGNSDYANAISANSGNDWIVGSVWSNTLGGGVGVDTVEAGPGTNLIYAGSGGTSVQPTLVEGGASGTSQFTQSTIYGGAGTDWLIGGPGSDLIYAGAGADTIYGGSGVEVMYGGSGTSVIVTGAGVDSAFGTAGSVITDSLGGADLLTAGAGAETLDGSGGDTLVGGSGADLLYDTADFIGGSTYEFGPGFGAETIGNGAASNETLASSLNDTLDFASGISPGALSVNESIVGNYFSQYGTALVINDGSSSILVNGGLSAGVVSSIVLPGIGAESLDQFMRSYGPGTVSQTSVTEVSILSTGDNTALIPTVEGANVFSFGDNDTITDTWNSDPNLIVAYGSSASINGYAIDAEGNSDSITLKGSYATVGGANDTLSVVSGNANIRVLQSSDVIEGASVGANDSIDALANLTLPTNIGSLTLDSAVGGLSAYSNAAGGVLTAAGNNDTLTGGSGNDTLSAQSTNDVLVGGAGSETYVLSSASDSIQYGTGPAASNTVDAAFSYTLGTDDNTLVETGVDYTATGNSANDSLIAQGRYDTLVAGSGNDTLVNASTTNVAMIGGAGNDTFIVTNSADVVQDTSATATNSVHSSVSFSLLTDINSLTLTGNANLVGTANNANDYLAGNSGNDTLIAGTGSDTIVTGTGPDTIVFNSGFGNDVVENANYGDVIEFGSGVSQSSLTFTALPGSGGSAPSLKISSSTGAITVQGGLVPGAVSSVQFVGGSSNTIPQLVAPSGRVTISGTGGNLILSPSNSDSVLGGSGQDTVVAWGNSDTLTAGSGGAEIYAGGTSARVTGSATADTLTAIGAADTLIGGAGTETFVVGNTTDIVQVSSSLNSDNILSSVNYSLPTNVSVLTLTGTASLQATGNAGADTLTANSGSDTLTAGSGLATLVGGSGLDTYVVDNSADVILPQAGNTVGFLDALVNFTMPVGVSAMNLNAAYITGTGNSQANYLYANDNDDTLVAGSGNETLVSNAQQGALVGGSSNDYLSSTDGYTALESGAGVDTLNSSYIYDTLAINNSSDFISHIGEYDTVVTSVNYVIPASQSITYSGNPLSWNLTGSANISATYDAGGSVIITGNSGNDVLTDASAVDTLVSGAGIDTLIGGTYYNTFQINNAADVIVAPSGSNNTVQSFVSYSLPANVDTLLLTNVGIVGVGNTDNDTMSGHYQDTLVAGTGNDSLVAEGTDTIVAGTGADTITDTGYIGGDVVVLNTGFGNTQVNERYGAIIEFGSGVTPASLAASAVFDVNGQGALAISGASGTVTLNGALSGVYYQFSFVGGSTLTLGQFLAQVSTTTSTLAGSSGNLILTTASSTALAGGSGNDTIDAAGANDTLTAGAGDQLLYGLGSNDSVVGGATADTLGGFGSGDSLVAGSALDTLVGGPEANVVFVVNSTADTIAMAANAGIDTLASAASFTLPEDVTVLLLTGTAALIGTAPYQDDTLISNSGVDTLVGGYGNDTFILNNSADVIHDSVTGYNNVVETGFSYTLPTIINTLVLTGTAALKGVANSGADSLVSNTGADTLVGGAGNDTFVVNNSADVIQDTATSTANSIQASISYSLPTNFNTLVLLGTASLVGTANAGADTITSNTGVDTLIANGGNDTFVINNSADIVQESSATANDTIWAAVNYSLPTNINLLQIAGSANLVGTANAGTDELISNSGVDTFIGGTGYDTFDVTNSADVIVESAATAGNQVDSFVSYSLPTNVTSLLLLESGRTGIANGGNDTLIAGNESDTLIGGAGNDTFEIFDTSTVIVTTGAATSNTIATSMSYTLPGNINNLVLLNNSNLQGQANGGNDSLVADSNYDTLVAGSGVDTLVGNGEYETYVLNNSLDVVQDSSAYGESTIQAGFSYSLPMGYFELQLTGTAALTGTGNSSGSILVSNSGVDTLNSGGGYTDFYLNNSADVVQGTGGGGIFAPFSYSLPTGIDYLDLLGTANLVGTANSDVGVELDSNTGIDTLVGGADGDTFYVQNSADVLLNLSADDTIEATFSYSLPTSVNNLYIYADNAQGHANSGNDYLYGGYSNDTLYAGAGADTLEGGDSDVLIGGGGNDTFVIDDTGVTVTDTFSATSNTASAYTSYTLPTNVNTLSLDYAGDDGADLVGQGNGANDSLIALADSDTLIAGSGADTLEGTTATDVLVGGSGNDTFVVDDSAITVTDTSTTATNTLETGLSYTLPTHVNALVLTGTNALQGTANSANDSLTANSGGDTLVAGSGTDTLISGASGTDSLVGGSGADTFIVNNTADVITDTSTTASNVVRASVNYSLPTNVNTLILTGTLALQGAGNSHTDSITANSGADTLTAGAGVGTLIGGAGNDTFVVNSTADVITDTFTTTSNTLLSSVAFTLPTHVNALTLTGTAALKGTANTGNDSLTANSGSDTLAAGSGVDTLISGATGTDSLVGGSGNDTFLVNNTADIVTDTFTTTTNSLQSSVSYTLPTNVNTLTLTGTAALLGTGNTHTNTMTANSGADTLTAGSGVATIVGGAGNDTFVVNSTGDVATDTFTATSNTLSSNVAYSLPTNINTLVFTGTAALKGTANGGADTLTANSGADTLVGGAGSDTFVISNTLDVVTDTFTATSNTLSSNVAYSLPTNINTLVFTGTAALKGTANGGADTLTANSGADTLVGGAGNDTFVISNTLDVVTDTFTATSNTLSSSVAYSLPTNINTLVFTGTAALKGTANGGADTLTANSGADTLVGGAGNDTFVISNTLDVVTDTFTTTTNSLRSSVSYTLPTDVNTLVLTGTAALAGTGNAHTDSITANSGADTLTAGSGVATLIGGAGTDTFVVNSTADVITVTATGTSDSVLSSVNYVLPTNVQYLTLTGTAALTATGNSLTDLILGNTGADTLTGGSGIAVMEGGRTAGSDVLGATSNQAALIAGAGSSTLTGGAYKDFYAAGKVSDTITTGATANVIAVNSGDGATTIQPTTSATDVLSLGAGIDTEALKFTKSGNNLILSDGVTGDNITLTNWYLGGSDQNVATLQVVEAASASYNSGGTDGLRNKPLEDFNFATLVSAFTTAGSPANWLLSNDMASAQITSSATQAYGGDLAYYFGLNGNLTGLQLSAAQSTLTNASFATGQQTIDSWSSVSGGGGLQLLAVRGPAVSGDTEVTSNVVSPATTSTSDSSVLAVNTFEPRVAASSTVLQSHTPSVGLRTHTLPVVAADAAVTSNVITPATTSTSESSVPAINTFEPRMAASSTALLNQKPDIGLRTHALPAAIIDGMQNLVTPTVLSWEAVEHTLSGAVASGAMEEFQHTEEGGALLQFNSGLLKQRPAIERGPLEIRRSA
jgi:Ca2+-binding RTX toxin-like protein